MNTTLKFSRNKSEFLTTARLRVDHYFKLSGQSRNANTGMWIKTIVFLTGFIGFYLLIISNIFPVGPMLLFAALLGIFSAFVGFNICHDAYTKSKTNA